MVLMVVFQWYAPVNLYSPQIKKKEMKKVGAFANYNGNSIKFCQSQNMTKQSKKRNFFNEFPPLQCYNHVNSSKVLLG